MLELLAQAGFRPLISFDLDDILSLVIATTALIALFVTKRTSAKSQAESYAINEEVDASVLGQFKELLERIARLERDIDDAKIQLSEALVEIRQLRKLEEYLQAKLHEKDQEVREMNEERLKLQHELKLAENRIEHLEQVCKRAGINGEGT